jgi:GNAT superfamily N-acetyltransferase
MNWTNGTHAISVVPIREENLREMAVMVSIRVKRQREAVPVLPSRFESPDELVPEIENLFRHGSGFMAVENGNPVGFMAGWLIRTFMGTQNGVFVPEAGFGTDSADSRRIINIFDALYAELCREWCHAGFLNHAIITYDEERELRNHLFHQGFGGVCMDAVRPALAMNLPVPTDLRIMEVKASDDSAIAAWTDLCNLHAAYMRSAPICLGSAQERHEMIELREWLSHDAHHAWIVVKSSDGAPAAYLQMEMETDGTSILVRDQHNMAVTGAFTHPDMRGNGVATLLLDAALQKAASLGMTSMSVDFESRNTPAMSFWTRHFTPFTFSVLRCVDGRLFKNA